MNERLLSHKRPVDEKVKTLVNDECQWIGDGVNMGLVTQHNSNHGHPQHLVCIPGLSGGKHGKSRR